ncbi:hypothetical protein GS894_23810 [Rhodococcus hoagii]|nr:hypothetical protein [Prescottella equi]NKT12025.1 hypothetical protein [Prescottella equi]NKT16255.1 hypothetical protein [Prescottella equi]NKT36056.1 hypothetical protein [Prescottella equi]NKT37652.1 hypothetical protein [Prescottella equi]
MTWIEYSGRVDHLAADHGIDGYTGCANHGAAFVDLETRAVVAILTKDLVDSVGDYLIVHGVSRDPHSFVEQAPDDFGVPGAYAEGQATARLYDIVRHLARILRPAVKSELRTGYRSSGGSLTWRTRLARAD